MSWERRMEQWKSLPHDEKSTDAWFESLSPQEREDAFIESKSFQVLIDNTLTYIEDTRNAENDERLKIQLNRLYWKKLDRKKIKKYLTSIVFHTPSLLTVVHNNKNAVSHLDTVAFAPKPRVLMIVNYEASGGIVPSEAYNLDQGWEPTPIEEKP